MNLHNVRVRVVMPHDRVADNLRSDFENGAQVVIVLLSSAISIFMFVHFVIELSDIPHWFVAIKWRRVVAK